MESYQNALSFLAQRLPIRDLTTEAKEGTLPDYFCDSHSHASSHRSSGIDGASSVVSVAAQILFRQDRRHLLITGMKGVGKTSAVVEIARQAATGRFHYLRDHRFIWLDATHVGPEDSRACLETILLAAQDLRPAVLCLDGIHALLRRPVGGSNKPLLRSGLQHPQIKVIGVLPRWEYSELISADAEMLSIFDRIEIDEPDEELALKIVESATKRLTAKYDMTIDPSAVRRAVFLSSNFMLSERLPSKAIKVLQQACDDVTFARRELSESRNGIDVEDVITVVSRRTGIPEQTLAGNVTAVDWESALAQSVVGQSRAVGAVANELRVIKAGLTPPGKPASVMLFAGMTGVGKTELAKRLAELYSSSRKLQNYSMANFTEAHSVSGIVGVPPGYVGHEQGGRLINDLNSDPYSVFLLDEAEKAHPNVWKPFLNLFDEGWIVDQRGIKASADRAIFVLTTNAGSDEVQQMTKNGRPLEEIEQRVTSILSRVRHERGAQPVFPPQFLARIKQIIVFQPLDPAAMKLITAKLAGELQARWLHRRDQQLQFDSGLIDSIGEAAWQLNERNGGREGGRAARKLVATSLEGRLAELAADPKSALTRRIRMTLDRQEPILDDQQLSTGAIHIPICVEYLDD